MNHIKVTRDLMRIDMGEVKANGSSPRADPKRKLRREGRVFVFLEDHIESGENGCDIFYSARILTESEVFQMSQVMSLCQRSGSDS